MPGRSEDGSGLLFPAAGGAARERTTGKPRKNAPLAERIRPQTPGRAGRTGRGPRRRAAAAARHRSGPIPFDHPLGAAGVGQDHARPRRAPAHDLALRGPQRRALRGQGAARDPAPGRRPARPAGAPHRALHRRDPSLQQGAAGRAPEPRRVRRRDPHRRHHREPVVRGQRRAPVPMPRGRAQAPRRGPARVRAAARARGRGARARLPATRGRPTTRSPSWPPRPTATRARRSTCSRWRSPTRLRTPTGAHRREPGRHAGRVRAQGPPLRQGRRGALQHHQRAAQVDPQLRRRCRPLLARAHAGGGRRPALRGAAPGALRLRGRRHGRPPGPGRGHGRAAGGPLHRDAGGRARPGRARRLPGRGPQEQRPLRRLRRGGGGRAHDARGARPPLDPQRADAAHEAARLRPRVPLRPRRGRKASRRWTRLPDALRDRQYYRPTDRGQEVETAARLEAARRIRQRARKGEPPPKD